jgi:hypothetical protein
MRETSCNSLSSPLPLTVVQSFCAGGASCISRGTLNEPPFTQYVAPRARSQVAMEIGDELRRIDGNDTLKTIRQILMAVHNYYTYLTIQVNSR